MSATRYLIKLAKELEAKYASDENEAKDHKRCNCEQSECERHHKHKPGDCKKAASDKKAMYIGAICDDCAKTMPEKYMLTNKTAQKIENKYAQQAQSQDTLLKMANVLNDVYVICMGGGAGMGGGIPYSDVKKWISELSTSAVSAEELQTIQNGISIMYNSLQPVLNELKRLGVK